MRSEWTGFLIAFLVWSVLAKKMSQFVGFVSVTTLLCAVALFFNLHMDGIAGRGGEVSVQGVVGRMIAPFDPTLAAKFVDDPESLGGTKKWREGLVGANLVVDQSRRSEDVSSSATATDSPSPNWR